MSTSTESLEVSVAEGREMLDRASRRWLNLSREEFVAKWDNGDFLGDERLGVQQVAMLLPFGRS